MLTKKDLEKVKELIEDFKPKNTFFENEILVPSMKFHLGIAIEFFEMIKEICKRPGLADDIGKALISTYDIYKQKIGEFQIPAQQGQLYLDTVIWQCDNSYIIKAKEILNKYSGNNLNSDQTNEFMNEVFNFFLRVTGAKEEAFMGQMRPTLTLYNKSQNTENIVVVDQIDFILRPFDARMKELVTAAEMAIETIETWRVRIGVQQAKHIDIIYSLANVKAAKINMRAQLAVIILAIVLMFCSSTLIDAFGVHQKNTALEADLKTKENALRESKLQFLSNKTDILPINLAPVKPEKKIDSSFLVAAGLPRIRFHDLRATWATFL